MEEWFRFFLRRLSSERLRLELDYIKNQWCVRLLQDKNEVVKLASTGDVINMEWWAEAVKRLDARLDSVQSRRGPPLRCDAGAPLPSGSKFQRLPETLLVNIAEYLDSMSVLRLGESCRQGNACANSAEVWRWRPLDLSRIQTLSQWQRALKRGLKSAHWNCARHVIAPKANALRVALELSSFFGGRLKVLDLTSTQYVAMIDYEYFLRMRYEILGERPEKILLPATSLQESRLARCTRRTLARHLAAQVFFDFCR